MSHRRGWLPDVIRAIKVMSERSKPDSAESIAGAMNNKRAPGRTVKLAPGEDLEILTAPEVTIERKPAFGTKDGYALRLCINGVPIPKQMSYTLTDTSSGATVYECRFLVDGKKIRIVE